MKGVIVLAVIVAVVVAFVPLSTVTYYEDEVYQAQVQKPLSYREIDAYVNEEFILFIDYWLECFVVIENTDTVPGTFTVDFTVNTLNSTFTGSDSAYIFLGDGQP